MGKGRPKKDITREFIVRIRVTPEELNKIDEHCSIHGYKSRSDLIRSRLKDILTDDYYIDTYTNTPRRILLDEICKDYDNGFY